MQCQKIHYDNFSILPIRPQFNYLHVTFPGDVCPVTKQGLKREQLRTINLVANNRMLLKAPYPSSIGNMLACMQNDFD